MTRVCFALLIIFAASVQAQNLVVNGDFEADTYVFYPGYNGGGDNPAQITGWTPVEGGQGVNPVFEPANPSSILGWARGEDSLNNIGINPTTDGAAPFADNGDVDGGVLFLQGTSSAYQVVEGLTIGETYLFGADYNARNCCGDPPETPTVSLEFNGEQVEDFPDPDEFFAGEVFPVETGLWWRSEFEFTADSESLRVEFFTEPTFGGDSTFTLDNVTLTPASGGDNLVVNGDFEDNLDAFVLFPGYLGSAEAAPRAPFRDNGNNDSQIAFLQGQAGMEQEITGLTPGTEYTISFDYNARNCCDDVPFPSLLIDGEPLEEFADEVSPVEPVGDVNEWYSYETTYVAEDEVAVLRFQTMSDGGGDSTFLLDNVFFGIPGSGGCDPNSQGDLDGNGQVEFADFLVLSANFGQEVDSHAAGDIDCNGTVEFADFLALSSNFGSSVGEAENVPEPNSSVLIAVAGFCLMRWLRKDV